jgi:hypothetical protein
MRSATLALHAPEHHCESLQHPAFNLDVDQDPADDADQSGAGFTTLPRRTVPKSLRPPTKGIATLYKCSKLESRVADPDPHYHVPEMHLSQNSNAVEAQNRAVEAMDANKGGLEAQNGALDAQKGALEAQNGYLEGLFTGGRRFPSL